MKIAVLVEEHYQILEAWYPYLRLREEGINTVFIGTGRKKEYGSKEGYPAQEGKPVSEINSDEFDGVIIPGGYAPDILRRSEEIINFVKDMDKKNKLVAAICHAGWVLVSSDILKDKKATCFSAIKDDVINAGAEFIDKEVVVDRNLITSRTPSDLPAFLREIINFLKSK
ncbi:MAG: type 1 glutamine amidotransferase [Victivallales bacterium]|nr:type 1 glutamine amidotransferase [Victivallales bacterium]